MQTIIFSGVWDETVFANVALIQKDSIYWREGVFCLKYYYYSEMFEVTQGFLRNRTDHTHF